MATPTAAEHRDLAAKFDKLTRRLRRVESMASRRPVLAVTEGDFNVTGGGAIRWYDLADLERFTLGNLQPDEGGTRAIRLRYQDATGEDRVVIGEVVDDATGEVRGHGILVENGSGGDVMSVEGHVDAGYLELGAGSDQLHLRDGGGSSRGYLGPVSWGGNSEGYGLQLLQGNGDDVLFIGDTHFLWRSGGAVGVDLEVSGGNSWISGGPFGAYGYNTRIRMQGETHTRQIDFRDGANSQFIPVKASAYRTGPSSAALKNIDGDVEPGALDKVRGTPIKRWRYKRGSRASDGTGEETPTPQIGPMAEDAPAEVASWTYPEGGLDLGGGLWLLWRGVQELADENDQLRSRVDDLEARLQRLESRRS